MTSLMPGTSWRARSCASSRLQTFSRPCQYRQRQGGCPGGMTSPSAFISVPSVSVIVLIGASRLLAAAVQQPLRAEGIGALAILQTLEAEVFHGDLSG
jgi:hypothetical protein